MNNNSAFYITTPIFYPTGVPHIGTAYNAFIADTLARYYRQKLGKDNVFFLTGTDEHGANIARKADEEGKTPQQYVDDYAKVYQDVWAAIGLSNDYFIRTTNPQHEKFAAELIQKSFDNGDIYEGSYEGLYCESCEAYYTEADLVDGKCPNHPTKTPVFTKEKNYYFKLSKYQDWLLELYDSRKAEDNDFVQPAKWAAYVRGLVESGLQDIPVTRANVKWGIPVPFDPEQTIYVWYDALPNYLSVLGFEQFAGYEQKFWPVANHLVGKDIIKFHAILWPAMLKSAGYEVPEHVIVHGFFTINGQKIGKSNNNAIDPRELAKEYGIDVVRYTLLSEFQVGNDGDFSIDRLKVRYEELANGWGNLLARVIHLANNKQIEINNPEAVSQVFNIRLQELAGQVEKHIEAKELFEALQIIAEITEWGNKYIDERKPWEKDKPVEEVTETLNNLSILLAKVNELYAPFMPESAAKAQKSLADREKIILFPKLEE